MFSEFGEHLDSLEVLFTFFCWWKKKLQWDGILITFIIVIIFIQVCCFDANHVINIAHLNPPDWWLRFWSWRSAWGWLRDNHLRLDELSELKFRQTLISIRCWVSVLLRDSPAPRESSSQCLRCSWGVVHQWASLQLHMLHREVTVTVEITFFLQIGILPSFIRSTSSGLLLQQIWTSRSFGS